MPKPLANCLRPAPGWHDQDVSRLVHRPDLPLPTLAPRLAPRGRPRLLPPRLRRHARPAAETTSPVAANPRENRAGPLAWLTSAHTPGSARAIARLRAGASPCGRHNARPGPW